MSPPTIPELPDATVVQELLRKYHPVRLDTPYQHLSEPDRLALREIVLACSDIDTIYWKQRSALGPALVDHLASRNDAPAISLRRLLRINFGCWDSLNNDRPFWGDRMRPPGGDLYPCDLTAKELDSFIEQYPESGKQLMSPTTLVRRSGSKLEAVPYEVAYREELSRISARLIAASLMSSDPEFRSFLRSRAEDLRSGRFDRSEREWVRLGVNHSIDVAIGPYETYDDGLFGVKTSYEATVLLRHSLTDQLNKFRGELESLERELPEFVFGATNRTVSIGVYDVIYAAGMSNMGAKAVAAMLPNDEFVRTEVGGRLLLFRNVAAAKFRSILRPIADRVLISSDARMVQEDAFVLHTLLHESAHALSAGFVVRDGRQTTTTINQALRERYSTIEEGRADLVGLVYLCTLTRLGKITTISLDAAYATYVANCVRSLRFGVGSDYARAAAISLAHFEQTGAVRFAQDKIAIDQSHMESSVRDLAAQLQNIAIRGDYDEAGKLCERLAYIPAGVVRQLALLDDVPVDVEFLFSSSWQEAPVDVS